MIAKYANKVELHISIYHDEEAQWFRVVGVLLFVAI
jgi:hypothetical protein